MIKEYDNCKESVYEFVQVILKLFGLRVTLIAIPEWWVTGLRNRFHLPPYFYISFLSFFMTFLSCDSNFSICRLNIINLKVLGSRVNFLFEFVFIDYSWIEKLYACSATDAWLWAKDKKRNARLYTLVWMGHQNSQPFEYFWFKESRVLLTKLPIYEIAISTIPKIFLEPDLITTKYLMNNKFSRRKDSEIKHQTSHKCYQH